VWCFSSMTVRELSINEESNKKAHKFQAVSKEAQHSQILIFTELESSCCKSYMQDVLSETRVTEGFLDNMQAYGH